MKRIFGHHNAFNVDDDVMVDHGKYFLYKKKEKKSLLVFIGHFQLAFLVLNGQTIPQ